MYWGKGYSGFKLDFISLALGLYSISSHNSLPLHSTQGVPDSNRVMRYTQALNFSKCNSRKQNGPTALMKAGREASLVENSFYFPNYAWPLELLKISECGLESLENLLFQ